jgi:phenylacetate-CoA ligase
MNDDSPSVIQYRAILKKRHRAPLRGRIYPALQRFRGRPLGTFLHQLQDLEQVGKAAFDDLHSERLREILQYARVHVPLYRDGPWRTALSAGNGGEIEAWPVLEKETLRAHFEELQAQPSPRRTIIRKTSGYSGPRTKVMLTPEADAWGWAHRYRGLLWHGIPIGVPSLRMSHDRRMLRDLVKGEKCIPSLDSQKEIDSAIRHVVERQPTLVTGPPSTLFEFARLLRERGITEPLTPFARVGGQQLFDFQRKEIQSVLSQRAIDSYGSTETGALAGECPAGSLHVYADHVHLEIFDGDRSLPAGEFGDVVVSALRNVAMPLIRYRVGDRARLSPKPCRCGLPHPVLTDLQARAGDEFLDPKGRTHHSSELLGKLGSFFADPLAAQVRQVQFHQRDCRNWEAHIEVSKKFFTAPDLRPTHEKLEERLGGIVRSVFGADCGLALQAVDSLSRDQGKFRYIASAIDSVAAASM